MSWPCPWGSAAPCVLIAHDASSWHTSASFLIVNDYLGEFKVHNLSAAKREGATRDSCRAAGPVQYDSANNARTFGPADVQEAAVVSPPSH